MTLRTLALAALLMMVVVPLVSADRVTVCSRMEVPTGQQLVWDHPWQIFPNLVNTYTPHNVCGSFPATNAGTGYLYDFNDGQNVLVDGVPWV
jgi:hypothetical protein